MAGFTVLGLNLQTDLFALTKNKLASYLILSLIQIVTPSTLLCRILYVKYHNTHRVLPCDHCVCSGGTEEEQSVCNDHERDLAPHS